jgi:ribosomal protein S18 acetylase RimI-like enzyme
MAKDLVITLLDADLHDRSSFGCGEPALNEYLRKIARQHLQKGIANTYVLVQAQEPRKILGFFTLSFLEVALSEIPAGYGKNLPKTHLPAAKLGRLAVDRSCRGHHYGQLLLVDAMGRVANAIRNTAAVVGLFVDAKILSTVSYYRKFGFIPLEDNPLTLMLPHQTILAAFSEQKSRD